MYVFGCLGSTVYTKILHDPRYFTYVGHHSTTMSCRILSINNRMVANGMLRPSLPHPADALPELCLTQVRPRGLGFEVWLLLFFGLTI